MTFHAREIQSYRQLPQMLYHFSVKDRDEPRPRGGLLRVREFIMKDAYSFDRDEAGLDVELSRSRRRRTTGRSSAAVSSTRRSQRSRGSWAARSRSTSSRPPDRARTRSSRARTATTRRISRSRAASRVPRFPERSTPPRRSRRPVSRRSRRSRSSSGSTLGDLEGDARRQGRRDARSRARPRRRPALRVEDARRARERLPAGDGRGDRARSAPAAGSLGPVGVDVEVVADEALREGSSSRARTATAGTCSASRRVATSSRGSRTSASRSRETPCPECGGALRFQTAIEVGHIFKFGDRYSEPLEATFLDEDGTEKPLIGGSYGIGPGRVMAAVVEQRHDENGIVWPASIAPYDVHVLALHGGAEEVLAEAERVAAELDEAGSRCSSTTATSAPERSSRTPISSAARSGDRREEDARRRLGRRSRATAPPRTACPLRRAEMGNAVLMARRRRYSDDPFGPTIERLMEETGTTYRGLADKADLSAGYLNHIVHGNRPVPSNDVIARIAESLGVEPEHFREYRIRVITDKLEAMPELIDRL